MSRSAIEINLTLGTSQGGEAAGDSFDSVENLLGSDYNDQLTGDRASNFIYGRAGNDMLWGTAGDDILIGGPGQDILTGGPGVDTTSYHNSNSAVSVDLVARIGTSGDAEGDMFGSIEDIIGSPLDDVIIGDNANNRLWGQAGIDDVRGGTGNDEIEGGDGNDQLFGDQGNDLLIGGAGMDILTGGTGLDTFYFRSASEATNANFDTVSDFTGGEDMINLAAVDADTTTAGNQAFVFIDSKPFSGAAGEMRYDGDFLLADIDGGGNADFAVRLGAVAIVGTNLIL